MKHSVIMPTAVDNIEVTHYGDEIVASVGVNRFYRNRSTRTDGQMQRRDEAILIRSNKMQQYAGVYLLQNYSTCFGCLSHPSSGVHQTVTAASGTGHSVRATTFRQRGGSSLL